MNNYSGSANMKKVVLLAVVMMISTVIKAQWKPHNMPEYDTKTFHFGYAIGYNYANFAVQPVSNLNEYDSLMRIETTGMSGFDIGIVCNVRLAEYLDFRFVPSISLIDRKVDYKLQYGADNTVKWISKSVESVDLNLPVLLKLKSSRMGNFRFYAIGGVQYSFDMATRSKKRNPEGETVLKLKAHDVDVQAGVGIDFYLESFKLSLEGKMSYGVVNILIPENNSISTSLNRLSTKTFHFSILFE